MRAEIRIELEGLAANKGKGQITHPAVVLWARRKNLKDLGIVMDARKLYDDEAWILEFCETVYTQAVNRPKRGS